MEVTQTGSFSAEGATVFVQQVVAWGGGFVALGYDFDPVRALIRPRIWVSQDGREWADVDPSFEEAGKEASVIGLATLSDGRLVAIGSTRPVDSEVGASARATAWVASEPQSWLEVDLAITGGAAPTSFAFGPKGYVLAAGSDLWFSPDGLEWAVAHSLPAASHGRVVAAGNDGFVAATERDADGPNPVVLASGNGQSWFEASNPPGMVVLELTALGADWLATAPNAEDFSISVWASENGLDWVREQDVNDMTGPDGPKSGQGMQSGITGASIAAGGGVAFLTLSWNHCCVLLDTSQGVWVSTDGRSWSPVGIEDGVVKSVASNGSTTVLAGYTARGAAAAFWVVEP